MTVEESRRLLHELQVHQIELELQNEELRNSRVELETVAACYTDLYDFAPVGYFTLQRSGEIRQANLAGAGMVGCERANLIGQKFAHFVAAADLPVLNALLAEVFASDVRQTCALKLVPRNLPILSVQIAATGSADRLSCRAVVIDISERRQAQALKESEEKYRNLFEKQIDLYYRADPNGTIIMVSPSVVKISGYKPEEVIGSNVRGFYAHPEERDKLLKVILKNGSVEDYEITMKRKDGAFIWLSVNAKLNRDERRQCPRHGRCGQRHFRPQEKRCKPAGTCLQASQSLRRNQDLKRLSAHLRQLQNDQK